MARRPRATGKPAPAKPRPTLKKHLAALNLASVDDYLHWCRDNGFALSTDKDRRSREHEQAAFETVQNRRKAANRIHHNPQKLIEDACDGRIDPSDIARPQWRQFCRSIIASRNERVSRKNLKELLLHVNDQTDFVTQTTTIHGNVQCAYVDALIKINDRRGQWIHPLAGWRPRSHNDRRQFASLVRHLFSTFPVPTFMDQAWFRIDPGAGRLRDWFIHIGSGRNIRTVNKTPIPMTKKMAHHFLDAPDEYSVEAAIRWGQIHALGGDRRLIEAFLGSRIAETFDNNKFWTTVLRFFVANPMLERSYVAPIIDFLIHQKFETQEVVIGPGRVEIQLPPHPNLTMRGRTPGTLIAQVERWHRELGRTRRAKDLYFKRAKFKPFELRTGKDKKTIWTIRQLLSGAELIDEGIRMNHCVVTYADACANGACSIWSMERKDRSGIQKRQTVELDHHGTIVQCRGKQNRLPDRTEYDLLNLWARTADLNVSRYVGYDG